MLIKFSCYDPPPSTILPQALWAAVDGSAAIATAAENAAGPLEASTDSIKDIDQLGPTQGPQLKINPGNIVNEASDGVPKRPWVKGPWGLAALESIATMTSPIKENGPGEPSV